jgi:hypothetical protein
MNKTLRAKIKSIIRKHKSWAMECLCPKNDFMWGSTKKNLNNTLELMNSILKDIPNEAWPQNSDDLVYITDGNWKLKLQMSPEDEGFAQMADLKYAHDDHTALVIREGKKFVDFDIGGS